jgi:hypothetical protein
MRRFMQMVVVAFVLAALAAPVQATILYRHSGSNNPIAEGNTLDGTQVGLGAVNDSGVSAWNISGTDIFERYKEGISGHVSSMLTEGWWLDVKARGRLATSYAGRMGTYMEVSNGDYTYNLSVGQDNNDLYVYQFDTGGPVAQLFTRPGEGTAWHTYRLLVDPGSTTQTAAHLYFDGVYQMDMSPSTYWHGQQRFVWGATGSGAVDTNWAQVVFGIGVPPSVPEPSAIALLATGLLGLLAYAWRKRR